MTGTIAGLQARIVEREREAAILAAFHQAWRAPELAILRDLIASDQESIHALRQAERESGV